MKYHASQFLLPLTQAVTTDRGHSLICIPDRFAAETELTRLKAEYGPRLIKSVIRKDKPGRGSTYTLRYFTRETVTNTIF
jgi:hypothetical protein